MRTRDFLTAKIGETIRFTDGTLCVHYTDGRERDYEDLEVGRCDLKVAGIELFNEHDYVGAILDGVFYPPGKEIPTMYYRVDVYSPTTGAKVGYAHVQYHQTDACKKVTWVESVEDYVEAARVAHRRGQTALVGELLNQNQVRRKRVQRRWDARRFEREKRATEGARLAVTNE